MTGVVDRAGRAGVADDRTSEADGRPPGDDRPAAAVPPVWEWVFAVAALWVLGRANVLFVRQRTAEAFGGPVASIWQDDAVLTTVFITVQLAVLLVAVRRCPRPSLRRQPVLVPLLALVALAWLSVVWSVEPGVTQTRALMFAGTAGIGWYLASRLGLEGQIVVVAATAALGALASLVALVAWPDLARATNGVTGEWSGIYVNRNFLGLIMCLGLMAAPFLILRHRARPRIVAAVVVAALVEAFLLLHSQSRTAPVALVGALGVAAMVWVVRRLVGDRWPAAAGAAASAGIVAVGLLVVRSQWTTITRWAGRDISLTRRNVMWVVDRIFIDQRPWKGWGFEAIWAHPPTIEQAIAIFLAFPYSSHNGYYEIWLGLGGVGFGVLLAFLALGLWSTFTLAWRYGGVECLWPLTVLVFAIVINFSESFFVASDTVWALTVMAALTVAPPAPDPLRRGPAVAAAPRTPPGRLPQPDPT